MDPDCHERRFPVMGTTAHIIVVGGTEADLDAAEDRLRALEQRWSRFRPDSELSRLNGAAGVPCVVSSETYNLVADAVEAWQQTAGSFDPTLGAVLVAAGYDRSFAELDHSQLTERIDRPVPTANAGAGAGAGEIVLHPYGSAIQLPTDVRLDLGGIAKGAAADLVTAELLAGTLGSGSAGPGEIRGCLVNLGGDLRVAGDAPRSGGWRITLACPGSDETRSLTVADGAVCTSTKTKRRWVNASGPQHHLRDPATGLPLETGIASVTIVAARAAQAEVLTKAVFAAGHHDGPRLAAEAETTGLIVLDDGTVLDLPGLAPFMATARHPEFA